MQPRKYIRICRSHATNGSYCNYFYNLCLTEGHGEVPRGVLWSMCGRKYGIEQGSPTPGPPTGTGLRPVRNRAAQPEVSGSPESEASPAAPHRSPSLTSPPEPSPTPPTLRHCPWKNCLPRNRSLVPKRLGTAGLENHHVPSELNRECGQNGTRSRK